MNHTPLSEQCHLIKYQWYLLLTLGLDCLQIWFGVLLYGLWESGNGLELVLSSLLIGTCVIFILYTYACTNIIDICWHATGCKII